MSKFQFGKSLLYNRQWDEGVRNAFICHELVLQFTATRKLTENILGLDWSERYKWRDGEGLRLALEY